MHSRKRLSFQLSGLIVLCGAITSISRAADEKPLPDGLRLVSGDNAEVRKYLETLLYSRDELERWIKSKDHPEPYHPEFGWLFSTGGAFNPINKTYYRHTMSKTGERLMINYKDKPCRINTYGDSFTMSAEVNDGETFQERLAAHLCEPVRNFGIGGYSVYQAYRRLLREETRTPAPYIIFNIINDDHYRSLTGWRNIRSRYSRSMRGGVVSPMEPYVRVNPATGDFVEYENPCPTPESVYKMADLDWVYDRFKDDLAMPMMVAYQHLRDKTPERSYARITAIAKKHGIDAKIDSAASLEKTVEEVFTKAALYSSMRIVDKLEDYAAKNNKKVLYVLSYVQPPIADTVRTGKRFDQAFVDFLKKKNLPYVDLMEAHLADFAQYDMSIHQYFLKYWTGHYTHLGNYFEAFAIKDKLVPMLNPKPPAYSEEGLNTVPEFLRFPGRAPDLAERKNAKPAESPLRKSSTAAKDTAEKPKPVVKKAVAVDPEAREYLQSLLYTRKEVADWLAGKVAHGEAYDPDLGWIHNPRRVKNGFDNSVVTYSYDESGARHMMMRADQPCRINTYGNSYTHCDQVSDGETWQEVLAAHLDEPVRNYGIGGFSVYQAYRRLLREEAKTPTKYIIFNIIDDDHYRNLLGWRNIRSGYGPSLRAGVVSPMLPYVRVNPATGEFTEFDTPCPTPESVYNLCDLDWVCEQFGDNIALKIMLAYRHIKEKTPEKSYASIARLAKEYGIEATVDSPASLSKTADQVFTKAALYSTMRIVDKVEAYAAKNNKKVLYVLSYVEPPVVKTIREGKRFDQEFVDFLKRKNLPVVDLMEAHLADYKTFKNKSIPDYLRIYWIGHYNPRGNLFEAFAINDKLVPLLDPKPRMYNGKAGK